MSCKKASYPSKKNAKKAMNIINEQQKNQGGFHLKRLRAYYFCNKCNGFHLTSKK